MPKLYIMCGYPFAGKSTIARELVKQFGVVRVALDDINANRGPGWDAGQPISQQDWPADRQSKQRADVSDDDFYEVTRGFEAPTLDENPIIITSDMSLNSVMEQVNLYCISNCRVL